MSHVGGIAALVNNVTIWNGLLVTNNYCLENTCEAMLGSDFPVAEEQGAFVTETELQNLAGTLGDAYQADSDPAINGGYPVLCWQVSGAQAAAVSPRPAIQTDLSTTTVYYMKDAAATALSVTADAPKGGTLSYQWYSSTSASNYGYAPIEGETGDQLHAVDRDGRRLLVLRHGDKHGGRRRALNGKEQGSLGDRDRTADREI